MSPAFGADDYAAGQRHNLAFLQPVGARGEFPASMPVVGGLFVKDADALLIEELKRRGVLFRAGRITHSYPHCWRCGTPLLYYARTSWFVRTTAFKDAMLARNARGRLASDRRSAKGGSASGSRTTSTGRSRAIATGARRCRCGCATPTRRTSRCIGSFAELARARRRSAAARLRSAQAARRSAYVDVSTKRDARERCVARPRSSTPGSTRASMPFAQWHYPFENRDKFADAVSRRTSSPRGVDQTRGWFYSLLAIATGLGDALPNEQRTRQRHAPYRAVVVNDMVLDANGLKMSKSRGNVVDPWSVIREHGADAVRLFLVASSNVWVPRSFDERVLAEQAGRFLRTFKNVYSGIFAQYANFGWSPSEQDPPLSARPIIDRWMISRLARLERDGRCALEAYDATTAARAIIEFVDDDLANWYVRLNRGRGSTRWMATTTAPRSRRCTRCWCRCAGCSRRSHRSSATGSIAS